MKKIIFLDIDGVLNSDEYDRSEAHLKETGGLSEAYIMLIAHHLHLDPKAIELLNQLVEQSGAEVVLSSTWRVKYSPEQVTEMMVGRGARFKVSDKTPQLFGKFSERIPRGKEIGAYLRSLQEWPESYVIIDDHDDMLQMKSNLVKTNSKYGLTQSDVEKALKILKGEIE